MPYLFRLSGLSHLAVNRVHRSVKMFLERRGAAVFRWRQLWDSDGRNDVSTHVLPFMHYDVPNSCGPDPSVCCQFDFKRLTHFTCPGPKPVPITRENVAERARMLYQQYRKMGQMYRKGNVLLVLLGDDFRYIDAAEWSQQHDNYMLLFDYMNTQPEWNIHARFGTFSDYFDALESRLEEDKQELPTVAGDFFPYNDFADHYWTGYFTSRPHYKRMDRLLQAKLRAADLLSALALTNAKSKPSTPLVHHMLQRLQTARRSLALFQHHDAITGTSKWHVVTDYGLKLWQALLDAAHVLATSAQILLSSAPLKANDPLQLSDNFLPPAYNLSELRTTLTLPPGASVRVSVFNSLPHAVTQALRVHTSQPTVAVRAADGGALSAQVNPLLAYPGGISKDVFEAVWLYTLPPLSISTFTITGHKRLPKFTKLADVAMSPLFHNIVPRVFKAKSLNPRRRFSLHTQRLSTTHAGETGLMESLKDAKLGEQMMGLEFLHYRNTRSGAYLFMPSGPAEPWPQNATVIVIKGPVMSASHTFLQRLHSVSILYNSSGTSTDCSSLRLSQTCPRPHRTPPPPTGPPSPPPPGIFA